MCSATGETALKPVECTTTVAAAPLASGNDGARFMLVSENRRMRAQVKEQAETIDQLSSHLERLELRNEELEVSTRLLVNANANGQLPGLVCHVRCHTKTYTNTISSVNLDFVKTSSPSR